MCIRDRLNRLGTTVIMATHAKNFVNLMRKRVITLVDGRDVYKRQPSHIPPGPILMGPAGKGGAGQLITQTLIILGGLGVGRVIYDACLLYTSCPGRRS